MTVSYTAEVSSSSSGLGCFLKLLRRWRGSIYKLVWADLLLFMAIYYSLNVSHAFLMNDYFKRHFESMVQYCAKNGSLIPLSFVLGFYVNIVYTRWWTQYTSIPYPDNIAILVGANIKGRDERSRIFRRTIVRYVCVAFTMALTLISPKAKRRFPTLKHFVDTGLISEDEKRLIEDIDNEYPNYSKHWLPLAWASSITTRARHEGIIKEDLAVSSLLQEINIFRGKLGTLLDYDWISVPLVYTQVVTLAVYSYFLLTVIGNQFLSSEKEWDVFIFSFPFMPILEFFFYMGWLKVAETLINPFGEDDDDFEVMWMIDRNVQICYLLVDRIHQEHPKLEKDFYWDQIAPICLPFTIAAQNYIGEFPQSSTRNIKVKHLEQDLILPEYESQSDGQQERAELSKLWTSNKRLFSRRTRRKMGDVLLRQVIDTQMDGSESTKQTSTTDYNYSTDEKLENRGGAGFIGTKLLCRQSEGDNNDFKDLCEERLEKRKDKLLKYMELMRSTNNQEDNINNILK